MIFMPKDKEWLRSGVLDGEQQKGQIWQATTFIPSKKLDNLIAIVDFNGQQIDSLIEVVLNNHDLRAKNE